MADRPVRAVLMAGGGGERFWPRSRPHLPKQFVDLDGSGTLLQQTYRRALHLTDPDGIYVSTRAEYVSLVREQLPGVPAGNLIPEPVGRDTAPGIGLAAVWLGFRDPDAIMVALPADHWVSDEQRFADAVRAAAQASARWDALVTIGIQPTRPETGYGYLHVGTSRGAVRGVPVNRVEQFVEKPDVTTACGYLEHGGYLWNSGIFAWPVRVLLSEIERHLPELDGILRHLSSLGSVEAVLAALPEVFVRAPRISVDYGVLEKSDQVLVLPADFGWDDVGTWAALDRLRSADAEGNRVRGTAVLHESHNLVVEGNGRVIAAIGVNDLIIVDSDDALLICHKDQSQKVRNVAGRAEELLRTGPTHPPEPLAGQIISKPWGREVWWAVTDAYVGKLLEVRAGNSLSLQYHQHKLETMYVQRGKGRIYLDDHWEDVGPGSVFTLPPGTVHQLAAVTDLAVIEVSTPHLDDVVRLADRYGRTAHAVPPAQGMDAGFGVPPVRHGGEQA